MCTVKKNLFIILAIEFAKNANPSVNDTTLYKEVIELIAQETKTPKATIKTINEAAKRLHLSKATQKEIQQQAEDMTFLQHISEIQYYIDGKQKHPPLYKNRADKKQTPEEFVCKHYGQYIQENDLFQDQLSKIDRDLLQALKFSSYNKRGTASNMKIMFSNKEHSLPPKGARLARMRDVISGAYHLKGVLRAV